MKGGGKRKGGNLANVVIVAYHWSSNDVLAANTDVYDSFSLNLSQSFLSPFSLSPFLSFFLPLFLFLFLFLSSSKLLSLLDFEACFSFCCFWPLHSAWMKSLI